MRSASRTAHSRELGRPTPSASVATVGRQASMLASLIHSVPEAMASTARSLNIAKIRAVTPSVICSTRRSARAEIWLASLSGRCRRMATINSWNSSSPCHRTRTSASTLQPLSRLQHVQYLPPSDHSLDASDRERICIRCLEDVRGRHRLTQCPMLSPSTHRNQRDKPVATSQAAASRS
jgi:hypothetical protein